MTKRRRKKTCNSQSSWTSVNGRTRTHRKLKCWGTPLEKLNKTCTTEVTQQGHVARGSCVLFYVYSWYFITKLCPQQVLTTVPVAVTKLFFQLLFYLSCWYMTYDFLVLSVQSSLQGKLNCSYISVACCGGSRRKTCRGKLSGKKTTIFLNWRSLTISIATLAWETSLLGFLSAALNQPHVHGAI